MNWAERVMAGNSQPPAKSPRGRRIDWKQVMEKGFVGAIIGGLIALIAVALSAIKKKKG